MNTINSPWLYVLNWKSEFSYNESILWLKNSGDTLIDLAIKNKNKNNLFVICPSFDALDQFSRFFAQSPIMIGAQDCSPFNKGAYTGTIIAKSLSDLGCQYCIIGHSERRHYFNESNMDICRKAIQLFSQQITPILCIGETKEEYEKGTAISALEKQLLPLLAGILPFMNQNSTLCIAYEPCWAIGTSKTPDNDYLTSIFKAINSWCATYLLKANYHLLYGGNVNEFNNKEFKKIKLINGFLIGRISTNIDKLKKIIAEVEQT